MLVFDMSKTTSTKNKEQFFKENDFPKELRKDWDDTCAKLRALAQRKKHK